MVLIKKDVLKEIQNKIKEEFGCDVDEETKLMDIGDSLELTELVWKLEDKYDVSIPYNAQTIGEVLNACIGE
jgi:acyl carrier protein